MHIESIRRPPLISLSSMQVAMIYPPECVEKSDQYHYKIRLAKIGFLKYQIVPIYRRAATTA